ncbi:NAD(P)/FAD-dependent oxidoreductase [Hellea sp.]|nr:FAD/NAD(P)-binding oxidoreductase [Hellea sp.]MDB4845060.1 NAD(P)/FAD-dependent oxidoreductase [Hellea sp.]MDC0651289.1 NAD(P)/FAD-dependent oxidoreductase [Hellea sp.]MDC1062697.1 FAD/NAD(P)-binding oxidoreductase [Hellea sp.]MDC1089125.1 FAD/NAD(P)-binding oxidoreductase [Hellea sp.]
MIRNCVIIGGSHAGSQFAISLRQGGWLGNITIIGEERDYPYHRPPLSKTFLSGEKKIEDILLRPAELYEKSRISIRLGERVKSIDRANKSVITNNNNIINYDKLVIATGARVRKIPVPGSETEGVYYLRNSDDVNKIKSRVIANDHAVIIGGGYIGLETAASLRKQGMKVTVIEAMARVLQRVTAPELSNFYKRIHDEEGVEIFEEVIATEFKKIDKKIHILTSCGKTFIGDMVIVGIGVIPNIELAESAGLAVKNGVEVNQFCQTSDPEIYAIGDVSWHYNEIYERFLRLESVPNATEQAKIAALHINEKPKAYNSLPWFWSDQYDLKLQIAGLSEGYNHIVIRGDIEKGRSFSAFYFKDNNLLAVDAVNSPREFMFTKMVLTKGQKLNKEILSNNSLDLKSAIMNQ